MKVTIKKVKTSIFSSKDSIQWIASDENGHTGTGRTQEEAIGDIVLSYKTMIKTGENLFELEINRP